MDEAGLVDTNTFVHAHAHDAYSEECRAFLAALEAGATQAQLEPIVLHELFCALPHYIKQMDRRQVAEYLLMVLTWPGIRGAKDVMVDAVERRRGSERLAFVDSYLAALAAQRQCPVYTKNIREFVGQGILVPPTLPS
jgi:predicted nucleic acid-binding protein